jgi:membrane protein YdbS with pleckstrin-like domain
VYVVLLVIWIVVTIVSFAVFGGPSSPVSALSIVVTFLILAVGLYAEWRYRQEQRQ